MKHLLFFSLLLISSSLFAMEADTPPVGQEMQMHYHSYAQFNLKEPVCDCFCLKILKRTAGQVQRQCDDEQCDGEQRDSQKEQPQWSGPESTELVLAIDNDKHLRAVTFQAAKENQYGILMGANRKPIVTFDPEEFNEENYQITAQTSRYLEADPKKSALIGIPLALSTFTYIFSPDLLWTGVRYGTPATIAAIAGCCMGHEKGVKDGFRAGYKKGLQIASEQMNQQETQDAQEQISDEEGIENSREHKRLRRRRIVHPPAIKHE